MENVAHALAGLLVAHGAAAWRARRKAAAPTPRFGVYAVWVSALANNVPDGDLVLTPLTGGKLGYLLHHRGHTHTLVVGVALGLLVAAAAILIARRRSGPRLSPTDVRWILGLGAFGPALHVSMDGWNVYGVHPFWPFDDRWFYGDAVFILEPLLWLAAVPALFRTTEKKRWRLVLAIVFAAGAGLPWLAGGFVPLPMRLVLLAFGAISVVLARRLSASARIAAALALFFGVPAVFLAASSAADAAIRQRAARDLPDETVEDAAISAWPANPLCWSAVLVSTSPAGDLVLRRASFALAPELLSVAQCPGREGPITAPLATGSLASDGSLRWEGEHRVPLARWRALVHDRCEVAALMRFLRAPFLAERGSTFVVGDLRFDRDERLDFAEVELASDPGPCPRFVPSWTPPRAAQFPGPP